MTSEKTHLISLKTRVLGPGMGWQPASVKCRTHPFIHILSVAGFQTQAQNEAVVSETQWVPEPKPFTDSALQKKFCWPLI